MTSAVSKATRKQGKGIWERAFPHAAAWLPALWLLWAWYADALGVNPIQAATRFSGRTALTLLLLSLACTPFHILSGWNKVLSWRRPLGLYAFAWAVGHLLFFAGVDYGFDWGSLRLDVGTKPYVWVGSVTISILAALALTSSRWWMARLGKRWKRLHRLVYLAGILALVHYFWVVKGNFLGLSGSIGLPLAYSAVLSVLLFLRLSPVRRAVRKWRALRPLGRFLRAS